MADSAARVDKRLPSCLVLWSILCFGFGESIRCSICDTHESGYSCLTNPPPPKSCGDELNYCISVAKYSSNGQLESLARSCSPFTFSDSCVPGLDRKTMATIQVCYTTCSKDGCNGSSSLHHILNLLRRKRK